ncbi:hypothetical protein GCM10009596_23880 [Arthrobacter rhombi]
MVNNLSVTGTKCPVGALCFTGRKHWIDPWGRSPIPRINSPSRHRSGSAGTRPRGPMTSEEPERDRENMATDYDAPRKNDDDTKEDSLEELKGRRTDKQSAVVDEDEAEVADSYELPGADLSGEELLVRVLPAQSDEFTCASCFLVRHRSQVAKEKNGLFYCKDCEG